MILLLGGACYSRDVGLKIISREPPYVGRYDKNWDLGFRIIKLTKK